MTQQYKNLHGYLVLANLPVFFNLETCSGRRKLKAKVMEPLRFIHAADLHLDSPFRGIGDASAALKEPTAGRDTWGSAGGSSITPLKPKPTS